MKSMRAKKLFAVCLSLALVISGLSVSNYASAAKKVTLKMKKAAVSVEKGKKATLKITKKNVKKIKSQKWSTSNKKIATVTKKGVVTGKKVGKATIKCKVKYIAKGSSKAKTKTLKCKVQVVKATAGVAATTAPTTVVNTTNAPNTSGNVAPVPTATAAVETTVEPDPTVEPTNAPDPTVEPTAAPTEAPVEGPAELVIPEMDLSDPSEGVEDVETVTDEEVYDDTTNIGDSHTSSGGVTKVTDNGMMRKQLTNEQLIEFMGQGWNLANTLESCGVSATSTSGFETGWGNVLTTQAAISGIKASGFNTVRIPVAWSNMMSDDGTYTIDAAYLKRVEQVMNYCLKEEMYVIINIHYDGDWWGQFGDPDQSVRDQAWARFESFWTQIADRYNEYSDRLIFESANEELGDRLNDDWVNAQTGEGYYTGILTRDECYEVTNAINQKFVEIVRKSGGNNLYRQLLIAGYNTDIDMTTDDRFVMPQDTVQANGTSKLNVSVHYYTPSGFCICEDRTANWNMDEWGTDDDIEEMHDYLDKMAKFTEDGYGIIIGEYGPQLMSKRGVIDFLREVMTYGPEHGMAPIIWNTAMYDRSECVITYGDIADLLWDVTDADDIPVEEGADMTGVVSGEIVEESTLEKVAEWNGVWTRTNQKTNDTGEYDENGMAIPGEGELGTFSTTSSSDGLTVTSNPFWWFSFVEYDWDTLVSPCIKITMASDATSKGADFQLGYSSDGANYTKSDTFAHDTYVEQCISLNTAKLPVKPWVVLSSPTPGATIVKIEIYDEKTE